MKNMTPAELKKFLHKIVGPPTRELEGDEYKNIWLMLQLIDPISTSNNQHTWTDEYVLAEKRYRMIYGLSDNPTIEEILPEE